jgi:hypothetical protein
VLRRILKYVEHIEYTKLEPGMKAMIAAVLAFGMLTGGLLNAVPVGAQSSPCTTNPSRC